MIIEIAVVILSASVISFILGIRYGGRLGAWAMVKKIKLRDGYWHQQFIRHVENDGTFKMLVEAEAELKIARVKANDMERVENILHYPSCWDDVAYPTVFDALREIFRCDVCQGDNHGR